MRAVIIDDERSGRLVLQRMLSRFCSEIEIAAIAESADEGKKAIHLYEPDIVFLDVEMPIQNGFEMLESLGDKKFEVVFVTAHAHHAAKASRFQPLHFLLKPINPKELRVAVNKLLTFS